MKTITFFFCGIFLSLSCMFSCSEQEDVLENEHHNADLLRTRSIGYIPEWWDGKSQLDGPYEYYTSYQDYPYNRTIPDTCDYYFNFSYSWGTSYASQYYYRLQLQYRHTSNKYESYHVLESLPDSEWHNIGEEYPKERYPGGVIVGHMGAIDLDANHLPKGMLNFRYRLLHSQYPATHPEEVKYNNTILSTKWTVISRSNVAFDNPYGYTSPDSLFFHISLPTDGTGSYTYSVYVDNEPVQRQVRGLYACRKYKKNGTYEISALKHEDPSEDNPLTGGIYKSGKITGTYEESTRDIYVHFNSGHFEY